MTRVYENRNIARVPNISIAVMVVVILFGFWDLWSAFGAPGDATDFTSAMFGVLFVGGGIIGSYTVWNESRDQAQWLDVDLDAGTGRLAVWRPFRPMVLETALGDISNWRYWVKVGKRNMRVHYLMATFPGYASPVYFELPMDKDLPEVFRDLAPEAVDDFETNTGRKQTDDEDED